MDPKIVKKTQDSLGKIIKKPPLTEKLLGKPPFRFLHDVVTSVIKTTGFMKGLYEEAELNSENVKEKEGKIAFLQKAIDMVVAATGENIAAKPAKIVAGHEPERTNEFLQSLAAAINANVDNDECVKKVLSGASGGGGGEGKKEEKREKDKERTRSASRKKDDGDKHKKDDKEKSHDRDKERDKKHRDRSEDKDKDKERHRDRREKSRDREERHRDKDKERRKKKEVEEKENESPEQNGEKESQDAPSRLQRPTSAKGSRRRRQGREARDDDDEEFQQKEREEPAISEHDLPPQVTAARKMARPPSARPAPPRPKQEGVDQEPAMRLGTGAPTNLIVDDGKQSDDEDENFLVEESAPPPPPTFNDTAATQNEAEDDAEHGALVKKMLESKKDAEQQQQPTKKTEIERPALSDAQRRKQRELVAKEIEKLQTSIQSLTRSANPLGKIMDYVQEDMDSMQKELDRWRTENKEHALALRREKNVTDRAIEPLKAQLAEVDRAISDQLDLIAACKSNIIRNDQRTQKMLQSIARS